MIWFDYDNHRWMSKMNYYIYFIQADINNVIYIGIGKDDLALRHVTGELDKIPTKEWDDPYYREYFYDYRHVLKLEEISNRLKDGQKLELQILAHGLSYEKAKQYRSICNEFQYHFKYGSFAAKESVINTFEGNFFGEEHLKRTTYSQKDWGNKYYIYSLNSTGWAGQMIYLGIGKGDFAVKHANGDVDREAYYKQLNYDPRIVEPAYIDYSIKLRLDDIQRCREIGLVDISFIKTELELEDAFELYYLIQYLKVFYSQSRFERRTPPYGAKYKWDLGFRSLDRAFWHFYDETWKIL